jgi:hypothetical protein
METGENCHMKASPSPRLFLRGALHQKYLCKDAMRLASGKHQWTNPRHRLTASSAHLLGMNRRGRVSFISREIVSNLLSFAACCRPSTAAV